MGGDLDFYNSYAQRGNLPIIEHVVAACLALFPSFGRLKLMRTWGGVMDMTMDGSPIIGKLPVKGLYMTGGWCYGGFKATPASGFCLAHTIARDAPHALNAAFTLERFARRPHDRRKGRGPVRLGALMRPDAIAARDGRTVALAVALPTVVRAWMRFHAADPLPVVRPAQPDRVHVRRRCDGAPARARRAGRRMVLAASTSATTRWGRTTNGGRTAPAAGSGSSFAATRARTRFSAAPRPAWRCRRLADDAALSPADGGIIDRAETLAFEFDGVAIRRLRGRHARFRAARQRRAPRRPELQVPPAARDLERRRRRAECAGATRARRARPSRMSARPRRSSITASSRRARTAGRRSRSTSARSTTSRRGSFPRASTTRRSCGRRRRNGGSATST